jgi:uncharacterized glyoxalase superfamily protein PhnB
MISNRTMPSAAIVIPQLVYSDVSEACDWLSRVFGFTERWRAGNHRAQLAFGDGALVVMETRVVPTDEPNATVHVTPESADRMSHGVLVRVDDTDAHHAHAREQGARVLQAPKDFPYGERQYAALDIDGHRWTFSQSIADVAPEDWGGRTGG